MPRPRTLSLPEQINAATREAHTHLNRLILQRLPLALPPHASDPSIYVTGLIHFSSIYITFEELWTHILTPYHTSSSQESQDAPDLYDLKKLKKLDPRNSTLPKRGVTLPAQEPRTCCSRIESILRDIYVPGLFRTERLRSDIANLIYMPKKKVDKNIEDVSKNGSMSQFIEHIKKNVTQKPHVLLAYGWVLYMALFSGGRYLRASLREAGGSGAKFWSQDPSRDCQQHESKISTKKIEMYSDIPELKRNDFSALHLGSEDMPSSKIITGLHFFYFVGDADGEDLKIDFKKRMGEVERLLTKSEKMDVIQEAQYIFKYMIEMVLELDALVGTRSNDQERTQEIEKTKFATKTRDSICLAKTRIWQKIQLQTPKQILKTTLSGLNIKNPASRVITLQGSSPKYKSIFMKLGRNLPEAQSMVVTTWPTFSLVNPMCEKIGCAPSTLIWIFLSLVVLALAYEISR